MEGNERLSIPLLNSCNRRGHIYQHLGVNARSKKQYSKRVGAIIAVIINMQDNNKGDMINENNVVSELMYYHKPVYRHTHVCNLCRFLI